MIDLRYNRYRFDAADEFECKHYKNVSVLKIILKRNFEYTFVALWLYFFKMSRMVTLVLLENFK